MNPIAIKILSEVSFECQISKEKLSDLIDILLNQIKDYYNLAYYDNDSHSLMLKAENNNKQSYLKIFENNKEEEQFKIENNESTKFNIKCDKQNYEQQMIDLQIAYKVLKIKEFLVYFFDFNQYENRKTVYSLEDLNDDTYHLVRNLKVNNGLGLGVDQQLLIGNQACKCVNLSSLYIDLSLCKTFQATGCLILGQGISKCKFLNELTLELMKTQIKYEGATFLGQEIAKCDNLTQLTLGLQETNIGSQGFSSIVKGISKSKNLERLILFLQDNSIGSHLVDFSDSLKLYKKLSYLHLQLGRNKFGPQSVKQLALGISQSSTINTLILNISGNNLEDQSLYEFGDILSRSSSLKNVTTDFHQFKASQSEQNTGSDSDICIKNTLEILNLDLMSSLVNSEGLKLLGIEISKCNLLKYLEIDLKGNNIEYQGACFLGEALSFLVNLVTLKLNFASFISSKKRNKVGMQGAISIGKGLVQCKNLQELYLNLCGNQIEEQGLKGIGNGISECRQLKYLNLDVSNTLIKTINSDPFIDLLNNICKCLQLQSLIINLQSCSPSQSFILRLPYYLKQLEYLHYFRVEQKYIIYFNSKIYSRILLLKYSLASTLNLVIIKL